MLPKNSKADLANSSVRFIPLMKGLLTINLVGKKMTVGGLTYTNSIPFFSIVYLSQPNRAMTQAPSQTKISIAYHLQL